MTAMGNQLLEVKNVAENVVRIKELFYKEHANLYLVLGDTTAMLIDTGTGILDMRKEAEAIADKPLMVINTHCHYDHCGGNNSFETVHIHDAEKEYIAHPDSQHTAAFLMQPSDFVFLPEEFDVDSYMVKPAQRVVSLHNNQLIDIGNFQFRVLHMPGHSPGSICLYEPTKKLLFSGDVIYAGTLYYNLPFSDTETYLKSLKQLSQLDITTCFPGHNEPLDKAHFSSVLRQAIKMLERHSDSGGNK